MGIIASISGAGNITLDFYQILSVNFRHSTPLTSYAKSNDAVFEIIMEINASHMFENNAGTLASLREWEGETHSSDTYYRNLEIQEIYADEVVRKFIFTQAYIERTHTKTLTDIGQSQVIELVIRQKRDKYKEIVIV